MTSWKGYNKKASRDGVSHKPRGFTLTMRHLSAFEVEKGAGSRLMATCNMVAGVVNPKGAVLVAEAVCWRDGLGWQGQKPVRIGAITKEQPVR